MRQLLTLRYRAGDRAGALAYYRRFCERLRAEFDVEPMPETVACCQAIVRGTACRREPAHRLRRMIAVVRGRGNPGAREFASHELPGRRGAA